ATGTRRPHLPGSLGHGALPVPLPAGCQPRGVAAADAGVVSADRDAGRSDRSGSALDADVPGRAAGRARGSRFRSPRRTKRREGELRRAAVGFPARPAHARSRPASDPAARATFGPTWIWPYAVAPARQ